MRAMAFNSRCVFTALIVVEQMPVGIIDRLLGSAAALLALKMLLSLALSNPIRIAQTVCG